MLARRSLVDNFFSTFFTSGDFWLEHSFPEIYKNVKTDVYEKDGKLITEVEVPGFLKDDITVTVDKEILTVEAKREDKKEEKNENYFRSERTSNSIKRSFVLPKNISIDSINTMLKNGVLTLTFDKLLEEKKKPKEIEIKTE